jgi:hypothetical protein
MTDKINSPGREANEALPAGERPGLVSEKDTRKTGEASRKAAGPDGGDAAEVGDTFKNSPGGKV